ncbi:AraC family transcriptional regulator [Vibrio sonorensis]|uniref:AraC family transcriptional regulator n=1 Tax=Vibrio sonorensis TaxID=1004316 RepID=UPI0008DA7068|nr:AraC family transcriptional regulator [Vibrio sonorensis]
MERFYQARVDRVIDYIQSHISEPLNVSQIASLAYFSEFHFNRVFRERTGESLYHFIRRLRLEKAAFLLSSDNTSITDVALDCGFSNSASFAKGFKQYFGCSASQWVENYSQQQEKLSKLLAKLSPEPLDSPVDIENCPPINIAYVRNIGNYVADSQLFTNLYNQLIEWAEPNGIALSPGYNLYHDNRFITDEQNLRVMVGLEVPDHIQPQGGIGTFKLSGGKYAVRQYYLRDDEFSEAWDWMIGVWLPQSGFVMDAERESMERCLGETCHQGHQFYQVEICVPVKVAK